MTATDTPGEPNNVVPVSQAPPPAIPSQVIPTATLQAVLDYLQGQPYREVAPMLDAIVRQARPHKP